MKGTSSKGKSPWKVKKASRGAGGIVIPNGAVLVNQGLGKIKLEEDYIPDRKANFPAATMQIENDVNSMATSTIGDAVEEGFTEEFTVTKVEPDNHMPSPERPQNEEDSNCCSSSCREEIESLKCIVKEIRFQVDKQNQVIREMKSGLRNAVMSLMTFCKDEEENDDEGGGQSSSYSQSQGETSRSVGEDSLPLEIPSGSRHVQSGDTLGNSTEKEVHSSEIFEHIDDNGTGSVDKTGGQNPNESSKDACVSLESSFISKDCQGAAFDNLENEEGVLENAANSSVLGHEDHEDEGGFEPVEKCVAKDNEEDDKVHHDVPDKEESDGHVMPDQDHDVDDKGESCLGDAGEGDDNQEDDQRNTEDDINRDEESSQVLPSSSDRKKEEDDDNSRGNKIKRRRLPRKTQTTDKIKSSTSNSKSKKKLFQCSKCSSRFKLEIVMRDHQRRVHAKIKPIKKQCHLCGKLFSDASNLRRHFLSAHEHVRFKCEYCPREFTRMKDVRYHEDTVHKGVLLMQQCKVCGKNYANSKCLQEHMKNVHDKNSGSKASKTTQKKIVRRLRKKK